MIRAVTLVVFALSGCVASQPLPQRIMPAPDGLKIADSGGREISFDRTQAGVETAINRLVGPSAIDRMTSGACEIVRWGNGLTLVFVKGAFVGWIAGPPVWGEPRQSAGNTCGLTQL